MVWFFSGWRSFDTIGFLCMRDTCCTTFLTDSYLCLVLWNFNNIRVLYLWLGIAYSLLPFAISCIWLRTWFEEYAIASEYVSCCMTCKSNTIKRIQIKPRWSLLPEHWCQSMMYIRIWTVIPGFIVCRTNVKTASFWKGYLQLDFCRRTSHFSDLFVWLWRVIPIP